MSRYLRYDEFMPFAPSNIGEQIRINHDSDDCSGSSKSMVVRREEDGRIVAYCHRCSKRGSYSEAYSKVKQRARESREPSSTVKRTGYRIPRDATSDVSQWGIKARVWAHTRGINNTEIQRFGIVWSEYTNSLYMPIYTDTTLAGYVSKPFTEGMPKYITRWNDKENALWINEIDDGDTIVLTEDIPSAIVVGRYINTIALTGVNITTHQLAYLSKYKNFIVWLDNDNRQVKMKQLAARNKLSLFGNVRVIHTDRDPKNLSEQEIKDVLQIQ